MSDLAIDASILTGAAVASNLFIVTYPALAKFYSSEVGRSAWTIMLAISALLDVSLVAYWFHWTVPEWIARTVYVLILIACWMKYGALIHTQVVEYRRNRR